MDSQKLPVTQFVLNTLAGTALGFRLRKIQKICSTKYQIIVYRMKYDRNIEFSNFQEVKFFHNKVNKIKKFIWILDLLNRKYTRHISNWRSTTGSRMSRFRIQYSLVKFRDTKIQKARDSVYSSRKVQEICCQKSHLGNLL